MTGGVQGATEVERSLEQPFCFRKTLLLRKTVRKLFQNRREKARRPRSDQGKSLAVEGLRGSRIAPLRRHQPEVVKASCHVGMLFSKRVLPDCQGALVESFRLIDVRQVKEDTA